MKKKKVLKIILIILLLIMVVLVIKSVRKISILTSLDDKISKLEADLTNCHIKMTYEGENLPYKEVNIYYKDGNKKTIINFSDGKEFIQFEYPEERKVFITVGEDKVYSVYEEAINTTTLYNIANSITMAEGIFSTINTKNIEGKECYAISGKLSSFVYAENTKKITEYVEKETGLTIKSVEIYDDNGIEKEKATVIQTTFNSVTDEHMKEPNTSGYIKN